MINLNQREQNCGLIITMLATTLLLIYIALHVFNTGNETAILATLATSFLGSIIFWFFVARHYRKSQNPAMINYLNIGVQRYILGILMIFYGVPKLLGTFFDYQLFALDTKLINTSDFQLAWFFYGKNKWFELFSGVMEFIPGILLLNRRTYYFAALILLPVTAQVFLLNLFFKIGGLTFPAAIILLASNLYIIYTQKTKIFNFFKSLNLESLAPNGIGQNKIIKVAKILGISLIAFSTFKRVKSTLFVSKDKTNYNNLIGAFTLQSVSKNGVAYIPNITDSNIYKTLYFEKQDRWNMLRRFNNKTSAFNINLNKNNNEIELFINTNGAGDEVDILDSLTVIKGNYVLENKNLNIKGIQLKDTLELNYLKIDELKTKSWFW